MNNITIYTISSSIQMLFVLKQLSYIIFFL